MILSMVVLPQPDGPTNAPTRPRASVKATSCSTSRWSPEALTNDFRSMRTSSSPDSPAGHMSFKGLHQQGFDHQHHADEGQCVGENTCHIEQLKRNADLESDPVRPTEQLDD